MSWGLLPIAQNSMRYYGSRYRDKRGNLFGHDAGFVKRRGEVCGCEIVNACALRIPSHIICY